MNKKEVVVEKNEKVSKFLQDFGFSFRDVNKILKNKDVKVNGKVTKDGDFVVESGDIVVFFYSDDMLEKKYEMVFENEDVMIVFKKQGIETDGEMGLSSILKVKAVHRLDRNTEGLVVYAKNSETEKKLISAFKNKKVHKHYYAEVCGKLDVKKVYSAYLVKDAKNSIVRIYQKRVPDSVFIQTGIETIKAGEQSSLVDVELFTGKTHQIRAHLAFLGHPIVGDGKYGKEEINKKLKQSRQKLCCYSLRFDDVGVDSLNNVEFVKNPEWVSNFVKK